MLKKLTVIRQQSLLNQISLQELVYPKIVGTTHWEKLVCVGYNPDLSQLEAVVHINQSTGYSGTLCSQGSPEFVRFFIDYHDGNGFQHIGLSSFRAYDISDAPAGPQHPISYMVSKELDANHKKKFCNTEVLPRVRAILSWKTIPSIDPNATPYYGNVIEADIVIKPKLKYVFPIDVNELKTLEFLSADMVDFSDLSKKEEIKELELDTYFKYAIENGVSPKRTFTHLLAMANQEENVSLLQQLKAIDLNKYDIQVEELISELDTKEFNVGYEELECVGLNSAEDTLGAVIHIKRPYGYSGNLCKKGSLEYVAFWADFNNNGTFEKYLGTTSVRVHDIKNIPNDGLRYAVFLKTDFSKYLNTCHSPKIVRIRAVLSWASPPNPYNPDQHVYWGSRMDRLVQLRPKSNQTSIIYSIGNVQVSEISPISHLAYPGNGGMGNNRPWGGNILIKGGIDNSGTPGTTKYRVEYSKNGVNWFPVTTSQKITTIDYSTPLNPFTDHYLQDPDGWFPYLANHDASNLVVIKNQMLAAWSSHPYEGKYYIRVLFTKGNPNLPGTVINFTAPVAIKLDNRRYITNYLPNDILDPNINLDIVIDGGECKTYNQGAIIKGKLKVRDQYYGGYILQIQPQSQVISNAGLITYDPTSNRNNANVNYFGPMSDKWKVDSSKLKACGYTLRLIGYERTILNSSHHHPWRDKYVGFSVK